MVSLALLLSSASFATGNENAGMMQVQVDDLGQMESGKLDIGKVMGPLRTSGVCEQPLDSVEACQAKAEELGVAFERYKESKWAAFPFGCLADGNTMRFNPAGPKTNPNRKCGGTSNGGTVINCICGESEKQAAPPADQCIGLEHWTFVKEPCNPCTALVLDFKRFHGKCSEYCAAQHGQVCTGAWDEAADGCDKAREVGCQDAIGGTDDALCQCGASAEAIDAFEEPTLKFIRVSSGSCESHGHQPITSLDVCSAAAKDLGLKGYAHGHAMKQKWHAHTSGCVYAVNPGTGRWDYDNLIFNVVTSSSAECEDCLCIL